MDVSGRYTHGTSDVLYTQSTDEALLALAKGRKVLLNPDFRLLKGVEGKFVPVFWGPVHVPNQAATMGILCAPTHPALLRFPTDFHTDWQRWDLCTKSTTMILPDNHLSPIVRQIDNFTKNRSLAILVEAWVREGRLVICSLDISRDPSNRLVARQLRYSLLSYLNTTAFRPQDTLSPDDVITMTSTKSVPAVGK